MTQPFRHIAPNVHVQRKEPIIMHIRIFLQKILIIDVVIQIARIIGSVVNVVFK